MPRVDRAYTTRWKRSRETIVRFTHLTPTRGILTLSLAVVAVVVLAATASTASAGRGLAPWYCSPPVTPPTTIREIPPGCLGHVSLPASPPVSFDFGDRQVETTSPVQRFGLGAWCQDPYACYENFTPSIEVSGDFAQTNNCAPTLAAVYPQIELQGCLISVTYTPTGIGPAEGTLSTGPGGPTLTLTGNGVTTPTPPALPLRLSVQAKRGPLGSRLVHLKKKLEFLGITNNTSTVVARGDVRRTMARFVAGFPDPTRIKGRLMHLRRLEESTKRRLKVEIKFAATDEFGQTATDKLKVRLCREVRHGGGCVR